MGLETVIGRTGKDASGGALSPMIKSTVERMRVWDRRSQPNQSAYRSMSKAFDEIKTIGAKLSVGEGAIERAAYIYRKAIEKRLTRGRPIAQLAAAALLPGSLLYLSIGGFAAPKLVKRFGAKLVLVVAMVILSSGMLLFTQISLSSSYLAVILPAQLIAVVGGSLAATASNIAALSGAKPGEEGIASGLINTSRQVGGPIGLAVSVSVIGLVTHGLGVSAPSGKVMTAFRYAFAASASFAALAVVTSLLLKGKPARSNPAQSSE
jgi:MFS family permease